MKRHLVLFLVVFIGINGLTAQEADEKIGNLMNQSDWFALADEYPKLKNEMQSEMLKHLSEAMIGFYFNQPQSAIQAIDWILANAQEEIGFGNVSNLILIKSTILGEQGLYAESADNLSDFLTQISAHMDLKDFPAHNQVLEFYEKMRNELKPEIIRPVEDIIIPITIEKTSRGQTIYVPVSINGKEYKFIFDTGAFSAFVSERFANEVRLRITDESFKINGIKADIGKRGTIDSIMVGDIVFKNPNIAIGLPNEEVDTIFQVDAVLGMDFIRRVGEIQIYPEEKKIIFPAKKELPLSGRNLLFYNGKPYIKAYTNTAPLMFHFDTGNVKTDLFKVYYEKQKEELDKSGNKKNVRRQGLGGIRFIDSYQIPKFPLTIGDCNFELTDVDVLLDNRYEYQGNEDGSLGMDFYTMFRKVIINFDDMFVKVEK
jgi:predicted aspartyl protease